MWGFIIIQVCNVVAAIDFIPELCKGYVARNFAWAMSCNSFIDVPDHFLCACIEHPHLTIDSEKKLCEALLLWVSNNGESSQCSLESSNGCYTDILRKVRISLLPLSFVAGKRRNFYFSKFADESIRSIFDLMKDKQMSPPCPIADDVFDSYRIRLTQYSEVSGTALAYFIHRNPRLKVLKAMGCSNLHGYKNHAEINKCPSKILPTSNRSDEQELFHELSQTCILKEMEFGWGFTPFSLEILRPSVRTLRVITFGLGASLGEHALTILPDVCPLLEEVVLKFQVISDCILRSIMSSLRNLKVLSLCYCLGILTSLSFQIRMPNLTTLRLERVTPGMTNDDLIILTRGCSSLHDLSLIGCMLLNSDSQHIISSGWPGLRSIHLEGCGKVTCIGVSSLLECKALEDLLLRHNGQGIQRNLIEDAASKLPLLRTVSLDLCDTREGGFDTPSSANRFFLSSVKIACCKTQRCAFKLQNSTACKMLHKETIVLEWSSKEVRTTIVRERV